MKLKEIWHEMRNSYYASFTIEKTISKELMGQTMRCGALEDITIDLLENIKLTIQDHIDKIRSEGIDV